MRLILNLLVIALALGSLQSCVSKKKFDELQAAKEASDQALAETQAQLQQLEEEKADLEAEMQSQKEEMESQMASLRNDLNSTKEEVAQVREDLQMAEEELSTLKEEIGGIFETYQESGLSVEEREGRLYVISETPVRYRSGSTRLSSEERSALEELAETLKNNPELKILVEGHTDTDGVMASAPYRDNWELSTLRALGVVRALLSYGVNPDQLAAAGRGEHMPAATNDTEEGKSENRRTVLLPDPAQIDFSKFMENN